LDLRFSEVVMKGFIFWDIMPCSPLKVSWCFRGICRAHLQGLRVSQEINHCFMLEMTHYSQTSVHFQQTTWCYIPKDRTLSPCVFWTNLKMVL
jgi:hypothetical protein